MYILKMNSSHNIHDCSAFRAKYTSIITSNCKIIDFEHCFLWKLSRKEGYGHMSYTFLTKLDDGTFMNVKKTISPQRLIFACAFDRLDILNCEFSHLEVSHICHTRLCCNPHHLELETREENQSRSICLHTKICENRNHPSLDPCIL